MSDDHGIRAPLLPFAAGDDVTPPADFYCPILSCFPGVDMQHGLPSHILALNYRIPDIGFAEIVMFQKIPCKITVGAAGRRILHKVLHQAPGSKGAIAHIHEEQVIAIVLGVPVDIPFKRFPVHLQPREGLTILQRNDDGLQPRADPLDGIIVPDTFSIKTKDLRDLTVYTSQLPSQLCSAQWS